MLESTFEKLWLYLLEEIRISQTITNGKISAVEISKQAISIFSRENVLLPSKNETHSAMNVDAAVNTLPFVSALYKNDNIPTVKDIRLFNHQGVSKQTIINCDDSSTSFYAFNVIYPHNARVHDRAWHINPENKITPHSHFFKVNNQYE